MADRGGDKNLSQKSVRDKIVVLHRYGSAIIVFVEDVKWRMKANNLQLSASNDENDNQEAINANKFWRTCCLTRDYLCHGIVGIELYGTKEDADLNFIATNIYHIYKILGVDLSEKMAMERISDSFEDKPLHYSPKKFINFDVSMLETSFGEINISDVSEASREAAKDEPNFKTVTRAELEKEWQDNKDSSKPQGWNQLYNLFGRIVHRLVSTRDSGWTRATRDFDN